MRTCAWGLRGPHTIKCLLFLAPNWQKPSIKRSIQVPIHMFVWWGSSHSGILHSASMAAAKSCQISRFDCPVWTSEGIAFVATRRKYEKTIEGTWPGHFSLGSIWWSDSSTRAPSKSIQINEHEWTSKEHPWTSQKLSNLMILIWFTCPMPWNPLFDLGRERFVCNQTMVCIDGAPEPRHRRCRATRCGHRGVSQRLGPGLGERLGADLAAWAVVDSNPPKRFLVVGGLEHEFYFSIQLGISSSQLTNSIIFQRGRYTTNQYL